MREESAAFEATKGKARELEGAHTLVEQRAADLEVKFREIELRLAEAKSIILAKDKEVADLKVAMEESENKFYDLGFADAENSSDPIMFQSQRYGFGEGWMAAVTALSVLEESPFRNPEQIPYLEPLPPPIQNLACPEEEDSQSMRALVEEINSYTESIDLEISSNPNAGQRQGFPNSNFQTTIDASPLPYEQLQDPVT